MFIWGARWCISVECLPATVRSGGSLLLGTTQRTVFASTIRLHDDVRPELLARCVASSKFAS